MANNVDSTNKNRWTAQATMTVMYPGSENLSFEDHHNTTREEFGIIIDEEEAAHASAGPSSYRTTPRGDVPSRFISKRRYPPLCQPGLPSPPLPRHLPRDLDVEVAATACLHQQLRLLLGRVACKLGILRVINRNGFWPQLLAEFQAENRVPNCLLDAVSDHRAQ